MKLAMTLKLSPTSGVDMDLVWEAERLGYDAVWSGEAYGTDAVTPVAWVLAQTKRIKAGTSIMQMPARTPACAAMTAMTLQALSGNRFLCGIGPSGPQVVEGWHGVPFGKPLAAHPRIHRDHPPDPRAQGAARISTVSIIRSLIPGQGPPDSASRSAASFTRDPQPEDLHRGNRAGRTANCRRGRRRHIADFSCRPRRPRRSPRRSSKGWPKPGPARPSPISISHPMSGSAMGDDLAACRRRGPAPARALRRRHGRAIEELLQRPGQTLRLRGGGGRDPGPFSRRPAQGSRSGSTRRPDRRDFAGRTQGEDPRSFASLGRARQGPSDRHPSADRRRPRRRCASLPKRCDETHAWSRHGSAQEAQFASPAATGAAAIERVEQKVG